MRYKFLGTVAVAASSAILLMGGMERSSDAGLFSRMFGRGGGYSACGQSGQSGYSSCGQSGGYSSGYSACGPQMQSAPMMPAPVSYQNYYQPAYSGGYYGSGCVGGNCPVSVQYSAPVQTSPVPLNPGESYVMGSLRSVPVGESEYYLKRGDGSKVVDNGLVLPDGTVIPPTAPGYPEAYAPPYQSSVTPQRNDSVKLAKAPTPAPVPSESTPAVRKLVMVSSEGCVHCQAAKNMAENIGMEIEVVSISENPVRVVSLWRGSDKELKSFPAWVILENNQPAEWSLDPVSDPSDLLKMAGNNYLAPAPTPAPVTDANHQVARVE